MAAVTVEPVIAVQPVIAHAGHWLVNLAFALPAVVFIGWLAWITLRDRRRQRSGQQD